MYSDLGLRPDQVSDQILIQRPDLDKRNSMCCNGTLKEVLKCVLSHQFWLLGSRLSTVYSSNLFIKIKD